MDQLHEELKSPVGFEIIEQEDDGDTTLVEDDDDEDDEDESEGKETDTLVTHSTACKAETNSQSDTDYETCDSGLSSERSSVEHSISSGDEGAAMDADRNSLDSQGSGNPPRNLSTNNSNSTASLDTQHHNRTNSTASLDAQHHHNRRNSELDRDSAICSSTSSIAQPPDNEGPTAGAKSRKDSENRGKKQSRSGGCEPKDTLVDMETGDLSDFTTENETSLKGKAPKSRHPAPNPQKMSRSRHCSDDKTGRLRTTSASQARRRKSTVYRSVISDTFDGKILSSVQCLTCERVS